MAAGEFKKNELLIRKKEGRRRVTRFCFDFLLKLVEFNLSHQMFFCTHDTHPCNQWSKWRHHQMKGT
jgi:hypothetical protein